MWDIKIVVTTLVIVLALVSTATVNAETVYVKYQGPVSLDRFQCTYTSSSFVHRICYRAERRYLVVLLNRTYYHYCMMPKSIVEQWLSVKSKGRFYNAYIKGNYDCRLGGIPTD